MKKLIALLLVVLMVVSISACGVDNSKKVMTNSLGVEEYAEFGSVYIKIDSEDFAKLGFVPGDSVDVKFSNGVEFLDVPFHTGYFVKMDEPVLVDYMGYDYICFAKNLNSTLWKDLKLSEKDSATISLNQGGKYLEKENILKQQYKDNVDDFESKEQFANFRPISASKIKENLIYRGASPVDNKRNRPLVVNELLEKNNIQYVIDIADTKEKFEEKLKECKGVNYIQSIKENNRITFLGIGADYRSDTYHKAVAEGMRAIINNDGPFYVHCLEGKDRTGFICLLIAGVAGTPFEEIKNDYLKTYENYYGIKEGSKARTVIANLYLLDMIKYLSGLDSLDKIDDAKVKEGIRNYLTEGGLSEDEINQLVKKISA